MKSYSKFSILFLVIIMSLSVVACNDNSQEKNIDKVGNLTQKMIEGEITEKEFSEQIEDISNESYDEFEDIGRKAKSLPKWAKKLGLFDPKGLIINTEESFETTEPKEGFNSVYLKYTGNYDDIISQAEKIAKSANIGEISQSPRKLNSMDMLGDLEGMGMPLADIENMKKELAKTSKGAIFTNSFNHQPEGQYMISITVDHEGILVLSAVDWKKADKNGEHISEMWENEDF